MADQDKLVRRQRKAAVTRMINNVERFIVEDDINEVKSRTERLKECFKNFEESHDKYHAQLNGDDAIEESDQYFFDVQNNYISAMTKIKAWLKTVEDPKVPIQPSGSQVTVNDVLSVVNTPKFEVEEYDGDPLKYHAFVALLQECVEPVAKDSTTKIMRMMQHCSEDIKNMVRPFLVEQEEDGYEKAKNLLKQRFGNPHIITERIVSEIRFGKPIKSPRDLRVLSDQLKNNLIILKQMGKLKEVDSQTCILEVINRLQPYLRNRWKRIAMEALREKDAYPDFDALVTFINREADEANDPVYGNLTVTSTTSTPKPKPNASSFTSNVEGSRPELKCILCNDRHKLLYCSKFREMKPTDRLKFVIDKKLCKNCLLSNHSTANCWKNTTCSVPGCGQKHTKFIHVNAQNRNQNGVSGANANPGRNDNVRSNQSVNVTNASTDIGSDVFMPIVPVTVNRKCDTYALLDSASSSSFCSKSLVDTLGVKGKSTQYSLSTLSQAGECKSSSVVDLLLASRDGSETLKLYNVLVVDKIPAQSPRFESLHAYPHLRDVPVVNPDGPIEILIGQDNSEALLPIEVRKGRRGQPFACHTLFGWTLNGPTSSQNPVSRSVISHFISTTSLEEKVQNLWKLENEGFSKCVNSLSQEDQKVLKFWDDECKLIDDHYQLPIPWKSNVNVPNNIVMAESRLKSLEISLSKKGLRSQYGEEMNKMFLHGYAEVIPVEEISCADKVWYLPHHVVLNPKKPGKIRIVFDCAAKYLGESLNNKCYQGPDLNNRLLHVMLRFRQHQFVVMSDIEAMYYQVLIPPGDRDSLRFLWYDENGEIIHCRMTRHLFGGIWCSSSSTYALRKVLEDNPVSDPVVSDTVSKSFYVDDCLRSCPTIEEAKVVVIQVKELLSKGGFRLTKFVVNDNAVLQSIPIEDRATEVKDLDQSSNSKALGVKWAVSDDVFYFEVDPKCADVITRRFILSVVSTVFDPLVLVSPVVLEGKLIFQDSTRLSLPWDEPVPVDLERRWCTWVQSLKDLCNIRIPRCVKPVEFNDGVMELHHFSDASQAAYGCVSYLRCINEKGQINVTLVLSRSKLAPIKSITIPRLELQAAVLAAQMDSMLRKELDLDLLDSYFWVDSELVIKYIFNETKRFQVFVGNRVSVIRELTNPSQWHHIAGTQNPADYVTRAQAPDCLSSSDWLRGPQFLSEHKGRWHERSCDVKIADDDPEIKSEKREISCAFVGVENDDPVERLLHQYSNWYDLKRSVAWFMRLKKVIRSKVQNQICPSGPLSVAEVQEAEVEVIKFVQRQFYASEIKQIELGQALSKSSSLRDLDPFLDHQGVLCVGGRLRHVKERNSSKHPYIVPHKHQIASVIVREFHELSHQGTEWTLSLLRKKFWITKARIVIKRLTRDCVTCKRLFGKVGYQKMADLPEDRLLANKPPFSVYGVDCFGPFHVKHGRAQA